MTPAAYAAIGCSKNFNSHPRKEDDGMEGITANDLIISTHILARRMTVLSAVCFIMSHISTHILARRMTDMFSQFLINCNISTHILARRMTIVKL